MLSIDEVRAIFGREFSNFTPETTQLKDELKAIFGMGFDLTERVQRLKTILLTRYPEGAKVSFHEHPKLSHLFFTLDCEYFYALGGDGIEVESNTMNSLCHDDDIVARFKPVFYELIKEWVFDKRENKDQLFSRKVAGLNYRLGKLGFQELDVLSLRRRILLSEHTYQSVIYSKVEARQSQYWFEGSRPFKATKMKEAYNIVWGFKGDLYNLEK